MAFQNHSVFALVPARGCSKGVPGKNLRNVKGRPLLEYTLDAASGSSFIDCTYVSSDDARILEVGRRMGAKTIVRPALAASDTATANEVVAHFLLNLEAQDLVEDPYIIYLQPTSPLRTSVHIDDAFMLMESRKENIVVSVVELEKTPYKSFTMNERGLLRAIFSERMSSSNRQTLPVAYYPNGAIYIFLISEFVKRGNFPCDDGVPFEMNERDSLDIDSEEDFAILDSIMENYDG